MYSEINNSNIYSSNCGKSDRIGSDNDLIEDRQCRKISIIGAELSLGCGKNGPHMAPDAIRNKDIINRLKSFDINIEDCGNISQSEDVTSDNDSKLKHITQIADFNERLAEQVNSVISRGNLPLILGGDHAIAIGTISGAAKEFGNNLGVVWIDAHTDINTEKSSPSGNIHGMPIAALLGYVDPRLSNILFEGKKISGDKVLIVAARDIDPGEFTMVKQENVHLLDMDTIRRSGINNICQQISQIIAEWNVDNIHLSIDIDSLDPKFVPGTGTPVDNGLSPNELFDLIDTITKTQKVRSVDVVELNPLLDNESQQTADITADIVEYVGKKLNQK